MGATEGLIHDLLTLAAVVIAAATFFSTRQSRRERDTREMTQELDVRVRRCEQEREALRRQLAAVHVELEDLRIRFINEVRPLPPRAQGGDD